MVQKSGIYNEAGIIRPKVKATFTHALLSDAVMAATAYIWWLRQAKGGEVLAEGWMVGLEAALLAGIVVVGGIGGTLTYNFGVGMSVGKAAGEKKEN